MNRSSASSATATSTCASPPRPSWRAGGAAPPPSAEPSLARLFELVDELVGLAADRLVEHDDGVIVRRVGEQLALADKGEARGRHLLFHDRRIDAVERVGIAQPRS